LFLIPGKLTCFVTVEAKMVDPSAVVDAYLVNQFGVGLEQVLLKATAGELPRDLTGVVALSCSLLDDPIYPDGGKTEGYSATMTVQGVSYDFRCWVYRDFDGERFLSDLSEFAPKG
jgi:hypothetical protein